MANKFWNWFTDLADTMGWTKAIGKAVGATSEQTKEVVQTIKDKPQEEINEIMKKAYGDNVGNMFESTSSISNSVSNDFSGLLGEIPNVLKDYLGITQREHLNRADTLAEQTQRFNEAYSLKALDEQARMFDLNYGQAQQNIDFQKEIAQKNLDLQTDAFNAQLAENQLTREREDNAYQRQVADLKAAGFSPLMASNGAGAAAMSVGSAPQYDAAAVSTAQGSAIQLAREYAALKNMAEGQYLTRKQAAANQKIGALMALSDLGESRRLGFQNLALQSFNLANSIKDSKSRRALIDEQIRVSKNTNAWMEKNGYRNRDLWNYIAPLISETANKMGLTYDKLSDSISNLPSAIKDIIANNPDKSSLQDAMGIKEYQKDLQKNFTNNELIEATMLANLGFKLNDKQLNNVVDFLYPKLSDYRKNVISKERLKKMIQDDGLSNVLSYTFGIK